MIRGCGTGGTTFHVDHWVYAALWDDRIRAGVTTLRQANQLRDLLAVVIHSPPAVQAKV